MATEILKIDASWAEEFTKTSEQILMTPSVDIYINEMMRCRKGKEIGGVGRTFFKYYEIITKSNVCVLLF